MKPGCFSEPERTERLLKKTIAIAETQPVDEQTRVKALRHLAYLYKQTNRCTQSIAAHKQVLVLSEKLYGPKSPELASDLAGTAMIYSRLNDATNAEKNYLAAIAIAKNDLTDSTKAVCYYNLASIENRKGDFSKADTYYQQAIAACPQDSLQSAFLETYASFLSRTGQPLKAFGIQTQLAYMKASDEIKHCYFQLVNRH